MNEPASPTSQRSGKVDVCFSIDADLLEQIGLLTNNPSKVVETALRQWLRGEGRRDDDLSRTLRRNPPVPPRGEWND